MSAAERLFALARAASPTIVVVGTAKHAGKTTVCAALHGVVARRGETLGAASFGRDGERRDAIDGRRKPGLRFTAGSLLALPAALLPRSPALEIIERLGESALGPLAIVRVALPASCELAGPPSARGMREIIARLHGYGAGIVIVDGALDRVAALAGGGDAVVVAAGGASGATVEAVAAAAADLVARLAIPGVPGGEDAAALPGALDARLAEALLAGPPDRRVVVTDPTRVAIRGALLRAVRAHVDLRCARPLRVVACAVSGAGGPVALHPARLVEAVARATALPTVDVLADLEAA